MRKAIIKIDTQPAGWLVQDDTGYHFDYDPAYLNKPTIRRVKRSVSKDLK